MHVYNDILATEVEIYFNKVKTLIFEWIEKYFLLSLDVHVTYLGALLALLVN